MLTSVEIGFVSWVKDFVQQTEVCIQTIILVPTRVQFAL